MSKKIEVDTRTFVRFWLVILGFVIVGLLVWRAFAGLIIVGIAAFLAIAIQPLARRIDGISKKKLKPALSSVIAYIIVMLVIGGVITVVSPVVVSQTSGFVGQMSDTFNKTIGGWDGINDFGRLIGVEDLRSEITNGVQSFASTLFMNAGDTVMAGVGVIANTTTAVILAMVLTLLFLLEGPKMMEGFWNLFGVNSRKIQTKKRALAIRHTVCRMKEVVATYVSKQVTVAILDGCVTALAVFAMSFIFGFSAALAIPMGLITMIFYLIPMFGAIIGCILVSLILFFSNPLAGVAFAIFYIVYQQIENNIIAPKIQGDALNMSVLMILIAITIGMYMFGLLGAIIAIPIAGCIKVLIEEYPKLKELQEEV